MGVESTVYGKFSDLTVAGVAYSNNVIDNTPTGMASAPIEDCGIADSPCTGVSGAVCLIERGTVSFYDKIANCEAGGGVGAIIYNNEAGNFFGTIEGNTVGIPAVSISQEDGQSISVGSAANMNVYTGYGYSFYDGTSMATPHVSAVAALVWSNHPQCNNKQIREVLGLTAKDLGAAGRDNTYGYGLVQAKAAVDHITTNGCGGDGGGGGGGGGGCELLPTGASCSANSECCSNNCKGQPGNKTCK